MLLLLGTGLTYWDDRGGCWGKIISTLYCLISLLTIWVLRKSTLFFKEKKEASTRGANGFSLHLTRPPWFLRPINPGSVPAAPPFLSPWLPSSALTLASAPPAAVCFPTEPPVLCRPSHPHQPPSQGISMIGFSSLLVIPSFSQAKQIHSEAGLNPANQIYTPK